MTRDLVVLVADKDIEACVKVVLARHDSLGTRPISARTIVHPQRDPGCYLTGHELLLGMAKQFDRALVIFDHAFDRLRRQAAADGAAALATEVEKRLAPAWQERARCIVIDPEVEAWLWSDSPKVERAMGWINRPIRLREWLAQRGEWAVGAMKPADPKRAFEAVMREVRLPPSSSIFAAIAETVSLKRCIDPSFAALTQLLQAWFPVHF